MADMKKDLPAGRRSTGFHGLSAISSVVAAFGFAAGTGALMIANASADQRIALDCRLAKRAPDAGPDISSTFCTALAQHLGDDLGLSVTPGNGPGHQITVELNLRSPRAVELTITTAPLRGGDDTSVKSMLVSHDGKISAFAARTLVTPIARQLGVAK